MKKLLLLLILVLAAFVVYKYVFKKKGLPHHEAKPLSVSKHSEAFNQSMASVLSNYYAMTEGFVNWDTAKVNERALALQKSLNDFNVDDLKKDSAIYQTVLLPLDNMKSSVAAILSAPDLAQKRVALQDVSDNLRMVLLTVKYDREVSYWQECPMAFGEGRSGNWLSAKEEVVNPYLGNKHPEFGDSMLHCGETKTVMDFTKVDSTAVK